MVDKRTTAFLGFEEYDTRVFFLWNANMDEFICLSFDGLSSWGTPTRVDLIVPKTVGWR